MSYIAVAYIAVAYIVLLYIVLAYVVMASLSAKRFSHEFMIVHIDPVCC